MQESLMPAIIDPTPAMESFQDALRRRLLRLERGRVDPTISFCLDRELARPRFVYVRLNGSTVEAYTCFVPCAPREGSPVFNVGYAVPEVCRGRGLAKGILAAGIVELRNGFAGRPPFFVEAIIDPDNIASLHVAAAVLGGEPRSITDQVSGQPAIQYIRKFETGR